MWDRFRARTRGASARRRARARRPAAPARGTARRRRAGRPRAAPPAQNVRIFTRLLFLCVFTTILPVLGKCCGLAFLGCIEADCLEQFISNPEFVLCFIADSLWMQRTVRSCTHQSTVGGPVKNMPSKSAVSTSAERSWRPKGRGPS